MSLQEFDWAPSVTAAQRKDPTAEKFIYQKIYPIVHRTAVAHRNFREDNVDDLVQEIYIAIFSHINQVKEPKAFLGWVSTVAERTCLNIGAKNARRQDIAQIDSLPDISDDEEMGMDQFSNDGWTSPDADLDHLEVNDLLEKVLGSIPDVQAACLRLKELDGYSVAEIAKILDLPLGTVKSNIRYARKKAENNAEELKKQGVSLYSLAPFAFLLWLLRLFKEYEDGPEIAALAKSSYPAFEERWHQYQIEQQARDGSDHSNSGMRHTGRSAGAAAAKGGISHGIMIATGVAAALAVAVGGMLVYSYNNGQNQPQETASVSTESTASVSSVSTAAAAPTPTEDPLADLHEREKKAADAYSAVLENIQSYDFSDGYNDFQLSSNEYYYALVYMNSSDLPQLLVKDSTTDTNSFYYGYDHIRVFNYNDSTGEMEAPETVLYDGATTGGRSTLAERLDKDGLRNMQWSGGTGDASLFKITLQGGNSALGQEEVWSGNVLNYSADSNDYDIQWIAAGDHSELDKLAAGSYEQVHFQGRSSTNSGNSDDSTATDTAAQPAVVDEGSSYLVTGTMHVTDKNGVLQLQNISDPNPEYEWYEDTNTYYILVLDEPSEMVCFHDADQYYKTHEVSMISLWDFSASDGEHLTVRIQKEDLLFPSDTSLPLAQPSATAMRV